MEIVLYHQNQYHGMLEEYLSSGWVDSGSCISHGSLSLQKSIFSEYETSYAVALVHLESGSASSRLESVADHLLFLPEGEHSNFFEACLHADIALLRAQQ